MTFRYKISSVSEESRWVFIGDNGGCDCDAFINFVKYIQGERNLISVGEVQYVIEEDPNKFVYQWDDGFGIVFIHTDKEDKDDVLSFLQRHIDELNRIG